MEEKLIRVFIREESTINAIKTFRENGYSVNDISLMTKKKLKDCKQLKSINESFPMDMNELTIPGDTSILVCGPIGTKLQNVIANRNINSLAIALIDSGFNKIEAKEYESYLNENSFILLVEERV